MKELRVTGRKGAADRRVDVEQAIMELASRQHGVVTRSQLVHAGVSPDVVDRRVKAKRLRAMHRGVYVVGPLLAPHAQEMAAVLVCGEGGALSHWSAAALWQLWPKGDGRVSMEVSTPGGAHPRVAGVRVHRVRSLQSDEVTKLDGIPITTVARTLLDLAGVAGQRELERVLGQALSLGLVNHADMLSFLARNSRRPGTSRLRALLENEAQPALTRSKAEERFLALIRKAQLPNPSVNVTVAGYRVDIFWRTERFVVEIDGFAFHSSAQKFEGDRRRDAEFAAAGLRVMRVTWRQLVREPEAVIARLAQALARAPAG